MLIDAIQEQYGIKDGLTTRAGQIECWPYAEPQPSQAECDTLLANYNAAKATTDQVVAVKTLAGEKILLIAPEWKQRNMLARSIEIKGSTVQADIDELCSYKALWDRAQAIRAHSDVLEAQILNGDTVDINAGWPE